MLRTIPHNERSPSDLDSQFPKTIHCGLGTKNYVGPPAWQQLQNKIKK